MGQNQQAKPVIGVPNNGCGLGGLGPQQTNQQNQKHSANHCPLLAPNYNPSNPIQPVGANNYSKKHLNARRFTEQPRSKQQTTDFKSNDNNKQNS